MSKKILITGVAGFIGMKTCQGLLSKFKNITIIGIDNIDNYYDITLKKNRLKILTKFSNFNFIKLDICNFQKLSKIFKSFEPSIVIHLAAQAGVRSTLLMPNKYINSNILGFYNLLECVKENNIKNFIFASSSSVYGSNNKSPFNEIDNTDSPLNLYAATKKTNEILAYSYSYVHKIPMIGLRFFTVYGPWGRPDMLPFIVLDSIKNKKKFELFNKGESLRDFTFIDDVVEVIVRLVKKPPSIQKNNSFNKYFEIFNVGSSRPIKIKKFIEIIESILNSKAKFKQSRLNKLDMTSTYSNSKKINKYINYYPKTNITKGVKKLIRWYNRYYVS